VDISPKEEKIQNVYYWGEITTTGEFFNCFLNVKGLGFRVLSFKKEMLK